MTIDSSKDKLNTRHDIVPGKPDHLSCHTTVATTHIVHVHLWVIVTRL